MEEMYRRIPGFKAALVSPSPADLSYLNFAPSSLPPYKASHIFDDLAVRIERRPQPPTHLPYIVLKKTDVLALELPFFENEVVECVAFGTVSRQNFLDLFWESAASFEVYHLHVNSPTVMMFLGYQEQLFKIEYIRCDEVWRAFPDLFNYDSQVTPGSFFPPYLAVSEAI